MPDGWVWFVVVGGALMAGALVRAYLVKRRRRAQAPEREDIYPMF